MNHRLFPFLVLLPALPGCLSLLGLGPTPPQTEGANPLQSHTALTASMVPWNYPNYTCEPARQSEEYKLSATNDAICVDYKGGVMREHGAGGPPVGPMKIAVCVDGKSSQAFALEVQGVPSPYNECTAPQSSNMTEWVVEAKGCGKNEGLLTASSAQLEVLSGGAQDAGKVYATFKFPVGGGR